MFNERAGAKRCVTEIGCVLNSLPNRTALIVVDDGSTDGTRDLLAGMRTENPAVQVVTHATNRGYGAALRSGVVVAHENGFDYALFMDSDLTNAPGEIPRFAGKMIEGADVIKATRYSGGGGVSGVPFGRWIISAVGNQVARLLCGVPIHDCTNGFRAVKVDLLMRMTLTENRFPVIMEELYWCRFLASTYAEVPVILTSRTEDQRPTAFAYTPWVLAEYLKYPVRTFLGRRPRGLSNE